MCARVCVRVLAHQKFPRNIIYIHLRGRGRGRTKRRRTDGARTIDIIYKYHYYCVRVRVSVAHFPRDIMRLCWRVPACRACYCMYVYRYIDTVSRLCYVGLWRSYIVGSVCWLGLLLVCFRSCRVVPCVRCCLLLYGVLVL